MPGLSAVRVNDMCTGHAGAPSRPSVTGSLDVFINNLPALRMGDQWAPHGSPPHTGQSVQGSLQVFINTLPAIRVGDAISCGSLAATGSLDTLIG